MIISAIDIGTNSIRCMTARISNNAAVIIEQGGKITRIGKNVDKRGRIDGRAANENLNVLSQFFNRCKKLGSKKIVIIATSAIRDASNGKTFVEKAQAKLKAPIRIISGEEEALLSYLGVSNSLKVKDNSAVIDIGGGSTEIILAAKNHLKTFSMNIGAVRLTERFLHSDPPKQAEVNHLNNYIAKFLSDNIPSGSILPGIDYIIGAGGSITTLAAIKMMLSEYSHEKVHGLIISKNEIAGILNILLSIPLADRKKVVGLKPERADIIIAGISILLNIMDYLEIDKITVSDRGILYGLIINESKSLCSKTRHNIF